MTMNCEQVQNLLDEYADAELSSAARGDVDAHLAGCKTCRAELDALRQTAALVRSLPRVTAPEGLKRAIRAGVALRLLQVAPPRRC